MQVVLRRSERWAMTRPGRMEMKLADWAAMEGINLRTAQRMHSRGELPVPAYVTSTGRIMVSVPAQPVIVPQQARKGLETREQLRDELRALKAQIRRIERRLADS